MSCSFLMTRMGALSLLGSLLFLSTGSVFGFSVVGSSISSGGVSDRTAISLARGSLGVREIGPGTAFALFASSEEKTEKIDKAEDDDDAEKEPSKPSENLLETRASPAPPQESVERTPPASSRGKKLDPLVVSLTRMDEKTASAPTMQVPLWGELILDRSLFVLLPVAAFAVLGLILSIYVGINAVDSFVETGGSFDYTPPPASPSVPSDVDEGCRGLCSSQEKDLEGLRIYMNSFKKQ